MDNRLHGQLITLRPATPADRRPVFEWLALSDLTPSMLGAPVFPDNPVPAWEEFQADYAPYFFDGSALALGRCFIIMLGEEAIGQVNYSEVYDDDHSTELDIWLANSSYTNKGYGTDALSTLCIYLSRELGCRKFIIAPSRRNARALRSYWKAGFIETTAGIPAWFVPDYEDTVIMIRHFGK